MWHASPWDDELVLSKQTCDGTYLQLRDFDLIEPLDISEGDNPYDSAPWVSNWYNLHLMNSG